MAAKKQLTIGKIKESISVYDEFVEIPVGNDDSEYTLKLYPFFKPERVSKLVKEMIEFKQSCVKENIAIDDEEIDLIGFFIIKEFTNIKFTSSKKTKKIYEDFKILINSPLFVTILQTIPEDSFKQVQEFIVATEKLEIELRAAYEEGVQRMKDAPLQNKDVLFPNNEN